MSEIIRIKDLSFNLKSAAGNVNILKKINLSISKGQTISLVGPSGAGKTSMIMLIAGLEKVSSGSINILGKEISSLSEDELAAFRLDNIGIIFQNYYLIPTMTAIQNVSLPLELKGEKNWRQKALDALNAVGLKERAEHFPSQLSGGEQQRVAIARAFVTNPKIILADEPTGNLDSENGKKVMDLLFSMNTKHKTTLILITHDQKIAKRCKKHIHILDGKLANDNK